jgi:hypothetical protein
MQKSERKVPPNSLYESRTDLLTVGQSRREEPMPEIKSAGLPEESLAGTYTLKYLTTIPDH